MSVAQGFDARYLCLQALAESAALLRAKLLKQFELDNCSLSFSLLLTLESSALFNLEVQPVCLVELFLLHCGGLITF